MMQGFEFLRNLRVIIETRMNPLLFPGGMEVEIIGRHYEVFADIFRCLIIGF